MSRSLEYTFIDIGTGEVLKSGVVAVHQRAALRERAGPGVLVVFGLKKEKGMDFRSNAVFHRRTAEEKLRLRREGSAPWVRPGPPPEPIE